MTPGSTPTEAWCSDCQAHLPASEFDRNAGRFNGLGAYCRHHRAFRNERDNAVSRIAYRIAGGSTAFYDLPKARRLELRDLAKDMLDADVEFQAAGARITAVPEGFVYIITNPAWADAVKIGKAVYPEGRLRNLNTADPHRAYAIEYAQFFDDALRVEQELHARCADARLDGEWFRMSVPAAKAALHRIWKELG